MTQTPGRGASKDEWRRWASTVRSRLDLASISEAVVAGLNGWDGLSGRVLTYMPLPDEIDLGGLADRDLYVTRTPPEAGTLTVHALGGPTEVHAFGFTQPVSATSEVDPHDIDVALLPGLAFDRSGVRLGRGSGYFDELLPRLRPGIPLVGVTPRAVVVPRLPRQSHDHLVTHLATEDGVEEADDDLPETTKRFVAAAAPLGIDIEVHYFPDGTKTSQDAAEAIGCEVSAIVKSLVFTVDETPVVALLPGDLRLDPDKLAAAHGGSEAKRADLETARAATGFAAGGTPPFGHSSPIPIYADPALRRHDLVWAAAGTPTTVFPLSVDALLRVSGATLVELAVD